MCAEIRSKLNPSKSPAPASEILSDTLPPGSPPASVTRLLASLLTCDSDCDVIAATCLNELKDTLWEPRLRQALIYTQNFDFAAAHAVLCPNLHAE